MQRRRRQSGTGPLNNPLLVGAVLILVTMTGVLLSYNANKGLPFVPTFDIKADVPDSAELIQGSSDVRIGGARVGIVKAVQAMPPKGTHPAFARLSLKLDAAQKGLPVDSTVQVRPRSILGAKLLEITPGHSAKQLQPGDRLPLSQAKPIVELDEAFNVFDKETNNGLRTAFTNLGDALAGRGADINQVVSSVARITPPLQRVLQTLVAPSTDLRGFVRGFAATAGAIGPVSAQFGSLIDGAAVTFAALDAAGPALGQSLAELPPTEDVGTRALIHLTPVLADAAAITAALRPSTALIPRTSRLLADAVDIGTPILRRTPRLARDLRATLTSLDSLSTDPAASGAVRKLITTVTTLKPVLDQLLPAQVTCNILPLFLRNIDSALSDGDQAGGWLNFAGLVNVPMELQHPSPSPDLNYNPYPHENASECESGNETYVAGTHIGNPPGLQSNKVPMTSIDPAVRALAETAGLMKRDDLP